MMSLRSVFARCSSFVYVLFLCFGPVHSYAVTIEAGQIDDRVYEYVVLENGLRVILISDPDTDKAAASLDVHVGSSDNPKDREGLAHFLEHMLFLGTEKYPNADDYQAFISNNGGSHNAYTSAEHTNYFFDIDAQQLKPALDRFSQFFIAPLFDEAYVDRERKAVHSEYQAKFRDDGRRNYDVYRQSLNPNHPYSSFSVGSLETLADRPDSQVRDELIAFYKQHYSADQMALVVLGKESIKALKSIVLARFSAIPRHQTPIKPTFIPLFTPGSLPIEVINTPVKDIRNMSMVFPLPSVKAYYKEKPLSFLGAILGHEGEGSLLSVLKAKGWAESLSAGGGDSGIGNATFTISISLTPTGAENREVIRALVFHALDVVRESGIELWRYQEEQRLATLAFQFREKSRAISTVRSLADSLHDFTPEEVISGPYLYQRFDKKLINDLLRKLTPSNLYVGSTLPDAKTDQKTQYYQVPYKVSVISSTLPPLPELLAAQFYLPLPNIFIPDDYSLVAVDKQLQQPILKKLDNNSELWVMQDVSFGVPKASLLLRLQSPLVSSSLRQLALNQLLIQIINDELNAQAYPALIAGLSYSLTANSRGVDIRLSGYDNKMDVLLNTVLKQVAQPRVNKARFEPVKTELLRRLNNAQQQTPFRQLFDEMPSVLYVPYFADRYIAKELEKLSFNDVKKFAQSWLKGSKLSSLAYGNVDQSRIDVWEPVMASLLQKGEQKIAPAQVVKLPLVSASSRPSLSKAPLSTQQSAEQFIYTHNLPVDHGDTAVALYVQGADDTLEDRAKVLLLQQLLESSFYSQLRTEQQLGYIVFVTGMPLKKVPGSVFMVQSPSASVEAIQASIQAFLRASLESIPMDLSLFKRSVATKLLEKPQNLSAQASIIWHNILQEDSSFNYRQRLVDSVNQITVTDLKRYYQTTVLNSSLSMWFVASRSVDSIPSELSSEQVFYQYP